MGKKSDTHAENISRTPLKEANRLPLAEGTKTPLKDSVFSFLDSPRSPFKTLLNFASLGNRGALSPNNRVSTTTLTLDNQSLFYQNEEF